MDERAAEQRRIDVLRARRLRVEQAKAKALAERVALAYEKTKVIGR